MFLQPQISSRYLTNFCKSPWPHYGRAWTKTRNGRRLPLVTPHKSFINISLPATSLNWAFFFFESPWPLYGRAWTKTPNGRRLPLVTPHKSLKNPVIWTKSPNGRRLLEGGEPDRPPWWLPKFKNITTMLLRSETLDFFLYTSHWWPNWKGYQKKCCKICDTPFIRVEYTPTPNTVNFPVSVGDAIWIRTKRLSVGEYLL